MTQFSAECLYCDHKMRTATEAEHHTCEQNTLTDKIDTLRAQNAELLAALENILPLYEQSLRARGYDEETIDSGKCGQARAAIAKAKGDQL